MYERGLPETLVDAAEEVSGSGRWDVVNERITTLAAHAYNGWSIQTLGLLCSSVFSEYIQLKRAFNMTEEESSLLAWRARNLLELLVWALYCEKSRTNARGLYEDAGRDTAGIYDAFEKWGMATGAQSSFLNIFSTARQDLSRRAAAEGIPSLDADFKKVNDAAKECGIGDHFKLSYKVLSKFAHPTAIRIIGAFDPIVAKRQRECFFCFGCLFFRGSFDSLEKQLFAFK